MPDRTAQDFEPIPTSLLSKYKFDIESNLYPDEGDWRADLDRAKQLADSIATFKGRVAESGSNLLTALHRLDDLSILLSKTYTYALLRYAVDTNDDGPYQEVQSRYSEAASVVAFADLEMMDITEESMAALVSEEPRIASYRFAIEENRRRKPYALGTEEETLLSLLEDDLTGWQRLLFQTCLNRTSFRDIALPEGGEKNVWLDRAELIMHDDRDTRDRAFHGLYEDYALHNDVMVFGLIQLIKTSNKIAGLHRFDDALHSRYFGMYLDTETVDGVLEQVEAHADLYKQYRNIRRRHIATFSGIEKVEPWDMQVVPPDFERPRIDIVESTAIIKEALSFLGKEYSRELDFLFDPDNGRLDLVKGENRRPGAFATGYYGSPWQFFSEAYNGYIDDLMTLVHETGHAVHYKLVSNAEVLPVYYRGPGYFTESFAMMNELVMGRFLVDRAESAEDRRYYLQEYLQLFMRLFDVNMRCSFEVNFYRGVASGSLKDADSFNELTVTIGGKYNDDFLDHPELMYNWSRTHHFWTVPLYYFNYLFAGVLSIEYFRRHLEDESFAEKYVTMMRNGFDDTPTALLEKFLGIDFTDPELMAGTFEYLEELLKELEEAYFGGSRPPA